MPSVKAACLALGLQAAGALRRGHRRAEATDCYSPYDGMTLLQLEPCQTAAAAEIVSKVESMGCSALVDTVTTCSGTEVVCSKEVASKLEKSMVASVVSRDAGSHWRNSSGVAMAFSRGLSAASTFYSTWRNLEAQTAEVAALVQSSGGLATLETVGQSLQGRDLKIVRFRGAGYTSGDTRVVVTYNLHAREWITGMSGVYMVEHLIEKLQQDPNYLAGTEVVLMPMANPDGFQYSTTNDRYQRKNMRSNSGSSCIGVDLNRNWDANFGGSGASSSPCSQTYHGPSAESEPETIVIKQVMNEAPMTVYVDVHSYSALILSAYGYTSATHPRNTEYRALGGSIQAAIRSVDGDTWTEGPTAQVLYTASGVSNDYADKIGALGLCFELRPSSSGGGGFAPPASDILPGAQESYAGIIAAIDYAKSYEPPAPTPAPAPGSWVVQGSGCVMNGACVSSKNHPSNYGNNEQCNIELYGDIPISVESFSTESRYDFLTMGGTRYSGTSGPPSRSYSGSISWSSDVSVTNSGWRLCRTDA